MKLIWKTVITTEIITTTKVYQVSVVERPDDNIEFEALDATKGKSPLGEKTTREVKFAVLNNN